MLELFQVAEIIEKEGLLTPEQPLLAAVSGGADSLCLAWILRELGYPISIAHLNHGLRPQSEQEADYVRSLAESWNAPFFMEKAQPPPQNAGSLEAWARRVRYQFLLRIATKADCLVVATGHTGDDQVETILMNLMRGAGPTGLAGMAEKSRYPLQGVGADDLTLIRPLLGMWREQTEQVCRRAGLTPQMDASNQDQNLTRNRIRHQLLPSLEEYNPAIKGSLQRTGRLMRLVATWMENETDSAWLAAVNHAEPGSISLDRSYFSHAPDALGLSLIRRAHSQLTDSQDELDFELSSEALERLRNGHQGQRLSLPGNLTLHLLAQAALLSIEPERVLVSQAPQLEHELELDVGMGATLGAGWRLQAKLHSADEAELQRLRTGQGANRGGLVEAIGWPGGSKPMVLRPPAPGDRFQPLGMQGTMKLSDFFINEGVPRAQRAHWPLLVDNDEILWVVGLRLSEAARVKTEDPFILHLELVAKAGDGSEP